MATGGRKFVLVVLGAAAAVVLALLLAFWHPVRDAVADWWSGSRDDDVLTLPGPAAGKNIFISSGEIEVVEFAGFLSSWTGANIIVPGERSSSPKSTIFVASELTNVTPELVIAILRENGWRLRRSRLPGGKELYTLEPRER